MAKKANVENIKEIGIFDISGNDTCKGCKYMELNVSTVSLSNTSTTIIECKHKHACSRIANRR